MTQSVLISGGGIVGSFLGLELAARDIPFQIIEKNPYIASKDDHIRSLTLNLSACERLDQLGVTTSSSAIQEMNIFDGSGSGKLSFNSKELFSIKSYIAMALSCLCSGVIFSD
jgi:2-polyprenyl-6-methoxyphenol hydroxylase-like FAD-dependent oxidoreductase